MIDALHRDIEGRARYILLPLRRPPGPEQEYFLFDKDAYKAAHYYRYTGLPFSAK